MMPRSGTNGVPELDGVLHPDFTPVARALRQQLRGAQGGAAVCVYHEGECVVDLWGGARDASGRPWTRDTMAPSFSTTKGVASTLVHVMADRGLLDYEERVAAYWPEFGQAGKEQITLRQVLAHQSGLYHIRQMIDRADRMLDWEYMVAAIERAEPIHEPGTRTGYHGLTYGFLVGEILRRVTGVPFHELVQREIAVPLQLDGMFVGAPPESLDRAAELIWPYRGWIDRANANAPPRRVREAVELGAGGVQRALGLAGLDLDLLSIWDALAPRGIGSFDFGAQETLQASIPAANGLFTARSLARMYAALAAGGSIGGVRLLSPDTVTRASEVQRATSRRSVIPFDMRWRLGYHGVATSVGMPRRAFGHFGFGGSGAWADPSRGLAVALVVNCGLGTPFGDLRIVRIGGAALAAARRRRQRARGRSRSRTAPDLRAWAIRRVGL